MTSLLILKSMLFANALQKTKKRKKRKLKKIHQIKKNNLQMCRICNQERGAIPIFTNFVQPNIPEEIHNFSGVILNKSDNYSKHMCQNCLNLLNGCIMFREMCQQTNKQMIELSIKQECNINYQKYEENSEIKEDSEDSFNIPSPAFSDDNSALWSCSSCGKEFHDMPSYNSHLIKCSTVKTEVPKPPEDTKKKFLCDICGKTACSNASLLVHMGIHENIFPFKCDQCPYQGRTMDLLKVHKRSHLVDKPFKCTQCPKATTTSSNLAKHMRHVHSTNRPFKVHISCNDFVCHSCWTAAWNEIRNPAESVSPSAARLICVGCGRSLRRQRSHLLSRDSPRDHHIRENIARQIAPRQCTYCDKAFSYQHDMKRHIKDIHLRQGTVECDVCNKKFNTKKILQGHRWKIHKIKGERQGRLPSYLQCQMEEPNENINDCDRSF